MLWRRQKDVGPEELSRGVAADLEVCLFKLLQNSHPISSQLTTSTYIFRKLLWTGNNIFGVSMVRCKDKWMWVLHGLFVVKESIWLWSAVRSGLSRGGRDQCLAFYLISKLYHNKTLNGKRMKLVSPLHLASISAEWGDTRVRTRSDVRPEPNWSSHSH